MVLLPLVLTLVLLPPLTLAVTSTHVGTGTNTFGPVYPVGNAMTVLLLPSRSVADNAMSVVLMLAFLSVLDVTAGVVTVGIVVCGTTLPSIVGTAVVVAVSVELNTSSKSPDGMGMPGMVGRGEREGGEMGRIETDSTPSPRAFVGSGLSMFVMGRTAKAEVEETARAARMADLGVMMMSEPGKKRRSKAVIMRL